MLRHGLIVIAILTFAVGGFALAFKYSDDAQYRSALGSINGRISSLLNIKSNYEKEINEPSVETGQKIYLNHQKELVNSRIERLKENRKNDFSG